MAGVPGQPNVFYFGAVDGGVWKTVDAGWQWKPIFDDEPIASIGAIAVAASDPNIVYIGTGEADPRSQVSYGKGMYKSTDAGKTWTHIGLDPGRRGMLWAGTSVGVYVSFDQGDHWQSLRLNMPLVEIRDFAFHDNSVAIATFGRSLWVLDDLNPLRQMDEKTADSLAYLFKPEPATLRVGGRGFDRGAGLAAATNMDPIEVWSGEPRTKGAIIDYYLKSDARGPITLEIRDAAGKVVRHYSSATKFPELNPRKMDVPAVWRATPEVLLATAGMHRFAWDLREVSPGGPTPTGPAARFGGSGHAALPGQYSVRLSVDGTTYDQPMTVNMPSGAKYNRANLQAQVQVLDRIQALQIKVEAAEHEAERVHNELAALRAHARGSVARSIEAAEKRVRNIQGYAAPPDPDTSGEGGATPAYDSLEGLDATLAAMSISAQQQGMGPPKEALITGVHKTEKTAGAALAAWEDLEARDLQRLDAQLRKAHLQEADL